VSDFLSVDAIKVFSWLRILHDINPLYSSIQIRDDMESQLQFEGIPERLLETALVASEQEDIMLESITRSNIAREQTGISSVYVGPIVQPAVLDNAAVLRAVHHSIPDSSERDRNIVNSNNNAAPPPAPPSRTVIPIAERITPINEFEDNDRIYFPRAWN